MLCHLFVLGISDFYLLVFVLFLYKDKQIDLNWISCDTCVHVSVTSHLHVLTGIYIHVQCVHIYLSVSLQDLNATNAVPMQTSLHIAAHEGYTRVIERLIGYGADPNMSDMSGNTPLSDVIRNRGVIKTPSEDSPQPLQVLIHVYNSCPNTYICDVLC